MKQFAKEFYISSSLKSIELIFALCSVDVTSIEVTKLSGLLENKKIKKHPS